MGLVGQFKFFFFSDIINVVTFGFRVALALNICTLLANFGVDFTSKVMVVGEELLRVYLGDGIDWDVRSFMLESSMDVNILIHHPTGVTETLDGLELKPLRRLGIIYFKGDIFTDLVSTSSNDHHEGAKEQSRVLIARSGHLTSLVGSFNPIPAAIAMSAETPSVVEGGLVSSTPSEYYHHSCGSSSLTESS